jgi:hypothetical protein
MPEVPFSEIWRGYTEGGRDFAFSQKAKSNEESPMAKGQDARLCNWKESLQSAIASAKCRLDFRVNVPSWKAEKLWAGAHFLLEMAPLPNDQPFMQSPGEWATEPPARPPGMD